MPKSDTGKAKISANPPTRQSLPPFEAVRAFDAVGRLGGIRRAAQWLDRDHAVVSRHVRTLESWLGIQLIERKPSGALLTDEGARYHAIVAQAMDSIAYGTLDLLNRGQHKGLKIFCAPGFALHWLSGHLDAFEAKNTDIDLLLRPSERSPDFAAHEADVDIRFNATYEEQPEMPALIRSQTVARVPIIAVASPDYLAKSAPIEAPADLLAHHLLHEDDFDTWANWLGAYGLEDFGALSGPRLSQGHLTQEAARRGRGIALANRLAAAQDLRSGRLVEIGRENETFPYLLGEYVLQMRRDRWNDRIPRRFRQWLIRAIERELPALENGPQA